MLTKLQIAKTSAKDQERISYSTAQYTYRYEGAAALEPIEEQTNVIILTAEQEYEIEKRIKIALLKQLQQKGMLTNEQLNALISLQDK